MLYTSQQKQIRQIIISFISINMMDVFLSLKFSPKSLSHYIPVLNYIVSIITIIFARHFNINIAILPSIFPPYRIVRAISNFGLMDFMPISRRSKFITVDMAISRSIANDGITTQTGFVLIFASLFSSFVKPYSFAAMASFSNCVNRCATIQAEFFKFLNTHKSLQIKTPLAASCRFVTTQADNRAGVRINNTIAAKIEQLFCLCGKDIIAQMSESSQWRGIL
jgi:hypothetical protein